jgi:hypothetical protein
MKGSPARLLSELTLSVSATRRRVPAGMTVLASEIWLSTTGAEELFVESALAAGCRLQLIKLTVNIAIDKK